MLSFRVRKAKDGSIVVVEPSEEFLRAFGEAFDTRYGPVPSGIDRFRVDADPASAKKLVESIRIEVTPDDIHDLALRWFLDTRDRNGGAGVVEGLLRDRFHCPDGIGAEVAQEIFTFARSHVEHVCEWLIVHRVLGKIERSLVGLLSPRIEDICESVVWKDRWGDMVS